MHGALRFWKASPHASASSAFKTSWHRPSTFLSTVLPIPWSKLGFLSHRYILLVTDHSLRSKRNLKIPHKEQSPLKKKKPLYCCVPAKKAAGHCELWLKWLRIKGVGMLYLIALKQPSPPARFYLCKAAAPSPCRQTLQILPTSGLKLHIPLPGLTLLPESAQITFLGSSPHLCLPTFPTGGSGSALLSYYYPPAC